MTIYARLLNDSISEYPFDADAYFKQLRQDGTAVRRVQDIPAERLADFGVVIVEMTTKPTVNYTQDTVEGTPVLVNGAWKQVWNTVNVDRATLTARIEERRNEVNDGIARRMIASDWTQLADGPANAAAWATWRSNIRALWNSTDPFSIAWPTPPVGGRVEFLARLSFLRETTD